MDDLGHQLQHAPGALEVVQRGPILVEPVEDFGMNGIGVLQALQVAALLSFLGEVVAVAGVMIGKGPADRLRRQPVIDLTEQPPPHDLEGFLGGDRLP